MLTALRRPLGRAKREALILLHGLRHQLVLESLRQRIVRTPLAQSPLRWQVQLRGVTDVAVLASALQRLGLTWKQGKYTIYIPPQEGLPALLGPAATFYPPDAGFKILKDFRPPDEAHYADHRTHTYAQRFLVGSLEGQLQTGSYLAAQGLAPVVYDLAELQTLDGAALTAFVVQHVPAQPPAAEECRRLVDRLDALVQTEEIAPVRPFWKELRDFLPPHAARNFLKSTASGEVYIVDVQEFRLNQTRVLGRVLREGREHLHFGEAWRVRGGRCPYQSVPGVRTAAKRDTSARWQVVQELLAHVGAAVTGRVVLDLGCNAGMMMARALAEGALWVLGWDLPQVVPHTRTLLAAFGFTRFTLVGTTLGPDYPLHGDIPSQLEPLLPDGVVFFLSMHRRIGIPRAIMEVPWRWMVFEGDQGEDAGAVAAMLLAITRKVKASVAGTREIRDGDSQSRVVVLLERHD